jgi:predicted DNA-binding protein (UPF0251 family)
MTSSPETPRRRPEIRHGRQPAVALATLEEVERAHVQLVLARSSTFEEASELLGINLTTLWRMRKRWGLG